LRRKAGTATPPVVKIGFFGAFFCCMLSSLPQLSPI
jgi:hypothetical protein